MGGLREHTHTLQQKAELPSSPTPLTLRLIDNHRVQQPASSNFLDEGRVECADPRTELLSEGFCAFCQTFVNQDVESGGGNSASQRVPVISLVSEEMGDEMGLLPSVCASVLSGLDAEHDLLVGQHGRHRVH